MKVWEGVVLFLAGLWLIAQVGKNKVLGTTASPVLSTVAPMNPQVNTTTVAAYAPTGPAGEASNGQTNGTIAGENFNPPPPSDISIQGVVVSGRPLPTNLRPAVGNAGLASFMPPRASYASNPTPVIASPGRALTHS